MQTIIPTVHCHLLSNVNHFLIFECTTAHYSRHDFVFPVLLQHQADLTQLVSISVNSQSEPMTHTGAFLCYKPFTWGLRFT